MTKAYQAYAAGVSCSAPTARKAAQQFFERFPSKRKCNVIEGKIEGDFFVVSYGRRSDGNWPESFRDITKKTAANLPD
jgi:hypothetical protein